MENTNLLSIPQPDEIRRRMDSLKAELSALSRLLRMARAAKIANEEKQKRESAKAVRHAD